jgi:ketosteroid isomerase-like protein
MAVVQGWVAMTHTKRANPARRPCAGAAVTLLTVLLSLSSSVPVLADDAAVEVKSALTQWMADFNAGKTGRVCDLFAADIRADYRGFPTRDHQAVCDLLTKSLTDVTRDFRYALDIKEILMFGDVAVVRLVWTLTIKEQGGREIKSVEPGMDIFKRQADGSWKIVRYMAYGE